MFIALGSPAPTHSTLLMQCTVNITKEFSAHPQPFDQGPLGTLYFPQQTA